MSNENKKPTIVENKEEESPLKPNTQKDETCKISDLQRMNLGTLQTFASNNKIPIGEYLNKSQIIFDIVKNRTSSKGFAVTGEGILEILNDGFGFLRSSHYSYLPSKEDIYISNSQIKRFGLRKGDMVFGSIKQPREKERYFALSKVELVNNHHPSKLKDRPLFDSLTPIHPNSRMIMETTKTNYSTRILDLIAPIGKGQRALIVAPPKAGKTMLLQKIANAITTNSKDTRLIVLLIDERPEEVTDMERTVKGEVLSSTFDEPPERHCQIAEICMEKVKRLVENGEEVVILLDSITRLARAYNTIQPHSGRILSGGVDANALHKPKRFFGVARNIEEGGSLTIVATAMIDTGSKMDEVIFEEFKGTGNMELVLDRKLADRRIYPAIDIVKSGTRKEELLYHPNEMEKIYLLRKCMADLSPTDAINLLMTRLKNVATNTEFLLSLKK